MKVTILEVTPNPIDLIGTIAGTSTGKDDPSRQRVVTCISNGHLSVFENAVVTFKVEGISRACSHQLVRHRLASYTQKSQRYTKIDGENNWYVVPPSVLGNSTLLKFYEDKMQRDREAYEAALSFGLKPEDARFLLPEAAKTDICVTMNARTLFHFFDLRLDKHAQWEIRELASHIHDIVSRQSEQWEDLINLYDDYAPFEA